MQNRLPIWVGVGGSPASFERAGALGLPLMIAIIGGMTSRFKPLVDMYYKAAEEAGQQQSGLKGVFMHWDMWQNQIKRLRMSFFQAINMYLIKLVKNEVGLRLKGPILIIC